MDELIVRGSEIPWLCWDKDTASAPGGVHWRNFLQQGGDLPVTLGEAEIGPGEVMRRHRHPQAEIYYLLRGEAKLLLGQSATLLQPGDSAFIPGNCWHGVRNPGPEPIRLLYIFPKASFEEVVYEFEPLATESQEGD